MNHDQLRRASQAVLPFAVPAMPMRPDNQTFQASTRRAAIRLAATRQAAATASPLARGAGP
jgi:hypothetical protein